MSCIPEDPADGTERSVMQPGEAGGQDRKRQGDGENGGWEREAEKMIIQSGGQILTTVKKDARHGVCMRSRLLSYWILMALLGFVLFFAILYAAGVFSNTARQLNQDLTVSLNDTGADITAHFDSLAARSIQLSRKSSEELSKVLEPEEGVQSLNDHSAELQSLEQTMLPALENILKTGQCSGAFLVLDATVNTHAPEASHSRSGLYVRRQGLYAANPVNQGITCYRGFQSAARSAGIELHNRWNPEFDTDLFPGFYDMMGQNVLSLSDGMFWTRCQKMHDTWENALLLCVPVTLADGTVCGLCGIEVSELYFRLCYPAQGGEFGSCITAIGFSDDGTFSFDGGMIGGQEGTALDTDQDLKICQESYFDTFTGQNDSYVGLTKSLPFRVQDGSTLTLAMLLPHENYRYLMTRNCLTWVAGSIFFFAVMLSLAFLFTGRFVSPIEKGLQAARDGENIGILEIDELVEGMQERAGGDGLPPKVEAFLTDFHTRVLTLTPMERTVLQYYIDGYGTDEIAAKAFISVNTVKKHNTNMNRKLGVSAREELQLYIEIFRRCGRIDEISAGGGKETLSKQPG